MTIRIPFRELRQAKLLLRFSNQNRGSSKLLSASGILRREYSRLRMNENIADKARQPPPAHSRPEAANFPTHQYTMSADHSLFQAPRSYPEPPQNLWYEVPKTPPSDERPKPIFPWEENQTKATRIFANEPPSPELKPALPVIDTDVRPESADGPLTPSIRVTPTTEPFSSFSRTNAWDDLPGIQRYVSAMQSGRRGKAQITPGFPGGPSGHSQQAEDVLSPAAERRPSLRLTDFPTEFERPSLPVTPAPVRRPSFWGQERDDQGELPGAEGVPKQEDWDPLKKLEELQRRQSLVLDSGPLSPSKDHPDRKLPGGTVLLPTSEETDVPQTSVSTDSHVEKEEANEAYGTDAKSGLDEGIFSPTPTG